MEARMNRTPLTLLTFLLLAVVPACGDGFGGALISDEQEVQLGEEVDAEIRSQYTLRADNDAVTIWARELSVPIIAASTGWRNPDDFGGYQVDVIDDDQLVNAFAAPGGFVYISTGLIMTAGSCAEIAGVVSHELAHVTERHGVKAIEGAYGVQVVSQWFLGDGLATDAAGTIYGFLANTQFSQAHESEADAFGLRIALGAGYNPYGLVDFFSKLLALSDGAEVPAFLSSHPATQDRIDAVTKQIESRYGDSVNPGTTQTYDCVATAMNLAQMKARIGNGQVALEPGTGPQ